MKLVFKLFNLHKYIDKDFSLFLKNEKIKKFIIKVENIAIEFSSIDFFKLHNIKEEQIGYRFNQSGKSLIGTKKGDWKKSWVVIGNDELGDPICIDFENPNLPVFTAEHGENGWIESFISISLDNFCIILNDLRKLKINNKEGISKTEIDLFLDKTKIDNKYMEVNYWQMFLEND
ncbi:SMI1/KNR4 family protein [Flavobacterium sp. GNP001]